MGRTIKNSCEIFVTDSDVPMEILTNSQSSTTECLTTDPAKVDAIFT